MAVPARTLEDITAEAKTIFNRMDRDYARFAELMVAAREQVPYGKWGAYLNENFPGLGRRQKYRYIELAKDPTKTMTQIANPTRETKSVNMTHLSPAQAVQLPTKNRDLDRLERKIIEKAKEKAYEWDQRSGVIKMYIKQFLTKEEPIGRDLLEAINNIDKFDSQDDLDQLRDIQSWLVRLEIRVRTVSHELARALATKEKVI